MFLTFPKKYFLVAVALFAVALVYFTVSPQKGEINKEYATKVVDVASEEKIIVNVDNIKASLKVDADTVMQTQEQEEEKEPENKEPENKEPEINDAEQEEVQEEEPNQQPVTGLEKGSVLNLNNEPLYISSTISTPKNYKTGTFYVWGMEANGRITITISPDFVGVDGKVTGWIDKPAQ